MRSITENEVRAWLETHPDETLKIVKDMNVRTDDIRTRSDTDTNNDNRESLLGNLLQSAILQDNDISKKLNSFCDSIYQLFYVEKCAIFLLNRDKNELEVKGNARWGPEISIKMSQGIVGRSASLNQTIFINDPLKGNIYYNCLDNQYHPELDSYFESIPTNILCIPFIESVEMINSIGVLCLLNRKGSFYDDYDLKTLTTALQFVIRYSLQSFSSLKEVENAKTENEKVMNELKKSKILLEFAISLYREDNLSKLMEQIILRARDLLSADKASVFVVDKERKEVIELLSHVSSTPQSLMLTLA